MIIAVSGVDCSGKSTQIQYISGLVDSGQSKIIWGRYGYTPGIEALKKIYRFLRGNKHNKNIAWTLVNENTGFTFVGLIWQFISIIDFLFYYGFVVRAMSKTGKTIILDRFLIDFFVDYELFHKKKVGFFLKRLASLVTCNPKCSFLLSVNVKTSIERMTLKNDPFPLSKESLEKRSKLYQEYRTSELIIDANRGVDEVFKDIRSYIQI